MKTSQVMAKKLVKKFGSVKKAAKEIIVSERYMYFLLNGEKEAGPHLKFYMKMKLM